jgi:hypothetical protein
MSRNSLTFDRQQSPQCRIESQKPPLDDIDTKTQPNFSPGRGRDRVEPTARFRVLQRRQSSRRVGSRQCLCRTMRLSNLPIRHIWRDKHF